jgi:hypothetical protein
MRQQLLVQPKDNPKPRLDYAQSSWEPCCVVAPRSHSATQPLQTPIELVPPREPIGLILTHLVKNIPMAPGGGPLACAATGVAAECGFH